MGAKTWMLVSADGLPREYLQNIPALLREESLKLAIALFPDAVFSKEADGSLSYTNPPDDEIFVGSFAEVAVVAAAEFGIDYPSRLPSHFLSQMPHSTVVLHAMHSVVDWFAFAVWKNGKLVRSLSLSPDSGILEDIGEKFDFELPFWAGEFPVDDDSEELDESERYPFVFHPLEMGEAALAALFGYVIEGSVIDAAFDAEDIPLLTLKRQLAPR